MKPIVADNIEYIELKLNATERRYYFPENNNLEHTRIDRIIAFSTFGDADINITATSGRNVVDVLRSRSAFVTLVNKDGKTICNKLAYDLFSLNSTISLIVRDQLDLKRCFVEFSEATIDNESIYFVLVAESQKAPSYLLNKFKVDVEVTPNTPGRYYFKYENFLKAKKIKAIELDWSTAPESAFVTLQTADNRIISSINTLFFLSNPAISINQNINPIQLADFQIQFKDSFIEVTDSNYNQSIISFYFYY